MEYYRAPEDVIALVHAVASEHHPHLGGHEIAVIMQSKATKSKGRVKLATTSLPTPRLRPLLADDVAYVICIGQDTWDTADQATREAIVDHELCHCALDPDDGSAVLRPHHYEEFAEIVSRRGFWRRDGAELAVQLALGIPRPEVKVSTLKGAA